MFTGVLVPFLLSSTSAAHTEPNAVFNEQFTIQIRILYATFVLKFSFSVHLQFRLKQYQNASDKKFQLLTLGALCTEHKLKT
jgi:hypothetical protein